MIILVSLESDVNGYYCAYSGVGGEGVREEGRGVEFVNARE